MILSSLERENLLMNYPPQDETKIIFKFITVRHSTSVRTASRHPLFSTSYNVCVIVIVTMGAGCLAQEHISRYYYTMLCEGLEPDNRSDVEISNTLNIIS